MSRLNQPETDMTQNHALHQACKRWRAGVVAVVVLSLSGCEVTNPGPVADEYLDLPEAHQALVNGAGARLSEAIGWIGVVGAMSAREIFPTGETSSCCSAVMQAGLLLSSSGGEQWVTAQQARWIAEDAIRRFNALGTGKVAAPVVTDAYLWAGYASRLLGENFCEAVFDGGPKQPAGKFFERAQGHFTNAITLGTGDKKIAAYAGRAQVRVWLKDWAGAVSDAQQVPLGFKYTVAADIANGDTRNQIYYANANTPYRGYTGWQTWFETYHQQTGDPRVTWLSDPRFPLGNATLSGYGAVPWSSQRKYTANNSPLPVASGREMVLIRAEDLLVKGDWQGAMTLINSLRTSVNSRTTNLPLAPWTATNLTEAWTILKRERRIELWLEARALGDLRRWSENQTPGVVDWPNYEAVSALFRTNQPSKCFPIPDEEIETNSNF